MNIAKQEQEIDEAINNLRAAIMKRRLNKARKYAAQTRERNIKPTGCAHCDLMRKLEEVQNVVSGYVPYKTIAEV